MSPLDPPAEWKSEEKEDFKQSSRKQQEAALRLHKSRNSTLEQIKQDSRELDYLKKLDDDIKLFLRALGLKESSPVAMQKAVQMWKEFEYAEDPYKAAAQYLKAKGKQVPSEWFESEGQLDPKFSSLQEKVERVEQQLAQERFAKTAAVLQETWSDFCAEKNAVGKPKFPDINDSESGTKLSSEIGSLVNGITDLSKQFIASRSERIPNLTPDKLFEEAYKFCGGKVDESTDNSGSLSAQDHIAKSRRASLSTPGRGAQIARATSTTKKYKTYREAAEAALATFKE